MPVLVIPLTDDAYAWAKKISKNDPGGYGRLSEEFWLAISDAIDRNERGPD